MGKLINNEFYNRFGQPMTAEAFHAIELARCWDNVDSRYKLNLMAHHKVTIPLLRIARQLVAMDKAEKKLMAMARGTQAEDLPSFLRKQAF